MKKMKKAFVLVLVCALALCTLAGCGNMSVGFGNFTFQKVHVSTYYYDGCFTIEKWHDAATGIEVSTKEAGSMFLSEGTYMLIEKDCPFCGE